MYSVETQEQHMKAWFKQGLSLTTPRRVQAEPLRESTSVPSGINMLNALKLAQSFKKLKLRQPATYVFSLMLSEMKWHLPQHMRKPCPEANPTPGEHAVRFDKRWQNAASTKHCPYPQMWYLR